MSYFPSLAFLGGSVGASEWVVLFVVVLIVVGPKRLPELARKFGRTMEMFRRAADEFKDQLLNMDQVPPAAPPAQTPSTASDTATASDTSTPSGTSDSYDNPYPDSGDYPGHEGQVENWSSDSNSDNTGPDMPSDTTGEEKPPEGGQ